MLLTGGAGSADGVDVGPDYSPDGSRLVFHRNENNDTDVYVMRAAPEGPDNVPLNLTDALPGQQRRPSWSPDGRYLAFWGHPTPDLFDQADTFWIRADGTRVQNLTDDQDPEVGDIMPDWGPRPSRR